MEETIILEKVKAGDAAAFSLLFITLHDFISLHLP